MRSRSRYFVPRSVNSSKFSSDQCVRLRLYRAQRSHVLFCTLDIDDTITLTVTQLTHFWSSLSWSVQCVSAFLTDFCVNVWQRTVQTNSGPSKLNSEFALFFPASFKCSATASWLILLINLRCHWQCPAYRTRYRLQCHWPMISRLLAPRITHPMRSDSPTWSWSQFQWLSILSSYIPPWNFALSSSFPSTALWFALGSIASALHPTLMNTSLRRPKTVDGVRAPTATTQSSSRARTTRILRGTWTSHANTADRPDLRKCWYAPTNTCPFTVGKESNETWPSKLTTETRHSFSWWMCANQVVHVGVETLLQ